MGYQRVSKPSSGNSQIHKKESLSTVPSVPVQAKSDSASLRDQEMPNYTPLAANWASSNNLMRSLSGEGVVQRHGSDSPILTFDEETIIDENS
jgi:hypothetical protein